MKRLNAVLVGTLGLMAALSLSAAAQEGHQGHHQHGQSSAQKAPARVEPAEAKFKDGMVLADDAVIELEDGAGEDSGKLVSKDGKKIVAKKMAEQCDPSKDDDYLPKEKKELDYDHVRGKLGKKGTVAGSKCEVEVWVKKGKNNKKCLKDAMIVIKKKQAVSDAEWAAIKADIKDKSEFKFKKDSAKADAEKVEFILAAKKKEAAARESKLKVNSKSIVQLHGGAKSPAAGN